MSVSLAGIGAFVANVASSVLIIFINKLLMRSGFNFAVTLSGLHYLTSALTMQAYKWTGLMNTKAEMPWKNRILFSAVSSISIISLNVSLLLNTVGFYQIAKLCTIPYVCVVEYFAYSRHFSGPVMASISLVMAGVAVVTVSDVGVNFGGLLVAILSVAASGSQQLMVRDQQKTLGITNNEMLLYTAWPMASFLLLVGPTLDFVVTQGSWVLDFDFSGNSVVVIVTTCVLALGVNLSQFALLNHITAVAYQVLGHVKTICVLIGGALLFQDIITLRVGTGMACAVMGMVGYGYFTHKEKQAASVGLPQVHPKMEEGVRAKVLTC